MRHCQNIQRDSPARQRGSDTTLMFDRLQRLRLRFLRCGAGALLDDEILALLLQRHRVGHNLGSGDVFALAQDLLARFGDFNRVLSAPLDRLHALPTIGNDAIFELKLVEAATHRMARSGILDRPVLSGWDAVLDYCHTLLAHRHREQFRVLFLDRKNNLLCDEQLALGTVDHVPIYPREVAKRALQLDASALILVHNHPSGDPQPSESDITMTQRILRACEALEIVVHDHIIIGHKGAFSMQSAGLMS